jgi:hypothetical protein
MPYMIRADWVGAAFAGLPVTSAGETHVFSVHQIGRLVLPSGRLAASDPFVDPAPKPFELRVAPGSYPIDLAVSELGGDDQRVAFARIAFQPTPVQSWAMALVGKQDPAELGVDGIYGYGVDAGTGCFMSPEAGELLEQRMNADEQYFEKIIADMEATYRHTWSWVLFQPDTASSPNIAAFSSGYGDGVYASYSGLGPGGELICVVTDFGVVGDAPAVGTQPSPVTANSARPWWKFWA